MTDFDPAAYGPAAARLLVGDRLNVLGPGTPNSDARHDLEQLTVDLLLGGRAPGDTQMAQACLAGLWLLHDYLDRSHTISQAIHTASGSFWHGIMHRREPDYDNAKYWFRRVGDHAVFDPLCQAARQLAAAADLAPEAQFLATQTRWDPFRFVDLVEAVEHGRSQSQMLCRRVQRCEWQLLFDYCYRNSRS